MLESLKNRLEFMKGNLWVIMISSGFWNLAGQMVMPFFSLYVLGLGGSYVDIGLISAIGSITRIIPALIGGYLADSIGRKKIVYTMTFLMGFNELVNAFAPSYHYLFLSAALGAIIGGIREPAFSALMADSTKPDSRALAFAILTVIPPLFGLLSPYTMGLLIDNYGIVPAIRGGYMFVFTMYLIATFLRYRYLEETLVIDENRVKKSLSEISRELIDDFKLTLRSLPRELYVFMGLDLALMASWAIMDPYIVVYATETIGLSSSEWGLTITLMTITNLIVRPISANAADRYGRLKFIRPMQILYPIVMYAFILSNNFIEVIIVRVIVAIVMSIDNPAWQALIVDYSPKEHRGRFNAIMSVFRPLIWSAGTIIGGSLIEQYTTKTPFHVSIVCLLMVAISIILFLKEPDSREE